MRNFHNNKTSIHPLRSARQFLERLPLVATLTVPLFLGGCADVITSLSHSSSACNQGQACGLTDTMRQNFVIGGEGSCGAVGIKWGDGDQETMPGNFDSVGGYLYVQHQYAPPGEPRVWPGPKMVHAYPAANCAGEAKLRFNLLMNHVDAAGIHSLSQVYKLGLAQPTATTCGTAPNMRPLRAGSIVHITSLSDAKINFGCAFEDCTFNMNGSSAPTPPNFPFPNHWKHSLVLRIVAADGQTQLEQGIWADPPLSFTVQRDGPLEFCVNDTILSDNTGAWGIGIRVDETNIP